MKVKDLVAHLQLGDQEAEVVSFGWFGQIIKWTTMDFCFEIRRGGANPQMDGSYLHVREIDLGPEPD